MTNSKVKLLSFVLAIKRKKSNSKLLYKPKYLLAKEFNLSPQTFSKYLKQCISEGFIIEESDGWRCIKLQEIFSKFNNETGLFYGRHDILKGKSTDFYQIQEEFEQGLLISNVIHRQDFVLSKKMKLTSRKYRTVKESLKKFRLKDPNFCAETAIRSINQEYVTSARKTGEVLGVSRNKANKILNSDTKVKRTIRHVWRKGIQPERLYALREEYPNTVIIAFPNYNAYKVCFGSSLLLR